MHGLSRINGGPCAGDAFDQGLHAFGRQQGRRRIRKHDAPGGAVFAFKDFFHHSSTGGRMGSGKFGDDTSFQGEVRGSPLMPDDGVAAHFAHFRRTCEAYLVETVVTAQDQGMLRAKLRDGVCHAIEQIESADSQQLVARARGVGKRAETVEDGRHSQ